MCFSSYDYQNISVAGFLTDIESNSLLDSGVSSRELEYSWRIGDYTEAVKTAFAYCAGFEPAKTDAVLKSFGLENGVAALDFSGTKKDGTDLLIQVKYRLNLPFAFFNIDHIDLKQQVKCGLWGN